MITIDRSALVEKLKEVGGHIAYTKSRRHPSTKPFLYNTKNAKDIINLEETAKQVEAAANVISETLKSGKQVLFVGGKPEAREKTKNTGIALSMPYVAGRFIGGSLTNFSEIKKRIDRLQDFLAKREKGEFAVYTKKEQVLINRDIERMTTNFGGLVGITSVPALMVIVDPRFEEIALTEAKYMRVPVVALANSDCNIKGIQHPIVVNESSSEAIRVVLESLEKAVTDNA
jgi:small subunit ribosomal protein S2